MIFFSRTAKIFLFLLLLSVFIPTNLALATEQGTVYFIKSKSFAQTIVNQSYSLYLERSIKKATEDRSAKAIILMINTPGGRVDSALKIKDIILASPVPIYAFINTHAISAGAIISLSTKQIIMAKGAVIGDSAPVYSSGGKSKRAGEKAVSAIRGIVTTLAQKNGRPERIAQAMVDSDIILTYARDGIDKPKDKLLTLSTKDALRLRIADKMCNSLKEILRAYKLDGSKIITLDYSASDEIVDFLTSPFLTGILLTLGMLGMIIEIKTPGWGVAGTIGILCLSLFFISQIIGGHTNWGAPVLFVIGLTLLMVEIFIIPGFGIVGIAGIGLILFSFFYTIGLDNVGYAARIIALSLIATITLAIILLRMLPKTRTFSKIVLSHTESEYKSPTDHDNETAALIGKTGTALSILRPAGTIEIEGKRLDAVSDGGFINANAKIKIVAIEGARLIVKEIS